MIKVEIKDRYGETLFFGSYHLIDSAIEAMGSYERHARKCLQCKEFIKQSSDYCSTLCQTLSFEELKNETR